MKFVDVEFGPIAESPAELRDIVAQFSSEGRFREAVVAVDRFLKNLVPAQEGVRDEYFLIAFGKSLALDPLRHLARRACRSEHSGAGADPVLVEFHRYHAHALSALERAKACGLASEFALATIAADCTRTRDDLRGDVGSRLFDAAQRTFEKER